MSAPLNTEARRRALDKWMSTSHVLHETLNVEDLLINGDISHVVEIRRHLTNLSAFAAGMKRAIQGIDEED